MHPTYDPYFSQRSFLQKSLSGNVSGPRAVVWLVLGRKTARKQLGSCSAILRCVHEGECIIDVPPKLAYGRISAGNRGVETRVRWRQWSESHTYELEEKERNARCLCPALIMMM